MYRLAHVLDLK